jgi:hypothetical protein
MKRSTIILAVGVLTFIVGVTTVAVLKIRRSEKDQNTQNPILADSLVAICDLIQNPNPYQSQNVHVAANLIGYHEIALYGASCKREDNYVRAEFGQALRQKLIQGIDGLNGGGLQRGNFWAHVILRGRFEKIPESDRVMPLELDAQHKYIQYSYRLVVSEVEKVVAVSDDVPWW